MTATGGEDLRAVLYGSGVWLAVFGILWLGLYNMNLATPRVLAVAVAPGVGGDGHCRADRLVVCQARKGRSSDACLIFRWARAEPSQLPGFPAHGYRYRGRRMPPSIIIQSRSRKFSVNSGAGTGLPNRYPWKTWQPSARMASHSALLLGPFRQGFETELVRDVDDGLGEQGALLVLVNARDEGPVDFHEGHGDRDERCHRGPGRCRSHRWQGRSPACPVLRHNSQIARDSPSSRIASTSSKTISPGAMPRRAISCEIQGMKRGCVSIRWVRFKEICGGAIPSAFQAAK